jgi:hypothetical protein
MNAWQLRAVSECAIALFSISMSVPAVAQWEAGAYIGAAHTQNSDLLLRQPSLATNLRFEDVSYRGESFQSPLYYGVRGGYFFRRHWGAEAEFTHLKAFANVNRAVPVTGTLHGVSFDTTEPMDTIIQRFSISHGVNLLLANIALRQQLWQSASRGGPGRLMLTFRIGLGGTIPHAETTIEEHANEHYQAGGIAGLVAGAGEVRVWSNVYWLAEYKYTRTRERLDVFSGNVTSLLRSQHIVTGPVVHF